MKHLTNSRVLERMMINSFRTSKCKAIYLSLLFASLLSHFNDARFVVSQILVHLYLTHLCIKIQSR